MKLYHYSNADLNIISPRFFKANSHTPGDSEIPRSYFYFSKDDREKFFLGSAYLYTVGVDERRIYDLSFDELFLLNNRDTIDDTLREIKNRGFIGVRFKQNGSREIVALFYPQRIIEKIRL